MKILLTVSVFLVFFGTPSLDAADEAQPVSPASSATGVETIVFIRHGEKPAKEIGQLNCQGLNRALALPRVLTAKFGKPDYIFAPAPFRMSVAVGRFNYIRPLATIEPTAIELGMPVNTDFGYTDIDGLRLELTSKKYEHALIFVAWEHYELESVVKQLVGEFGGDPKEVPKWESNDFDSIYIVRVSNDKAPKSASFTRDQEGLDNLSTDCPDTKHQ
jgi:hypothetical protein